MAEFHDDQQATYNRLSYLHRVTEASNSPLWQSLNLDSSFCSHISFDRKGYFMALFLNWSIIELWDVKSTMVPVSLLVYPTDTITSQTSKRNQRYCLQLEWSNDGN